MTACHLIQKLELQPHPEGGWYRETYRSEGSAEIEGIGIRNYSTCIYFLLTEDTFSAFHRIKQDEIWHFYAGEPLRLHVIEADGTYRMQVVGNRDLKSEVPQLVVPAGAWFAAEVVSGYALVGCTVAPGFDFSDFELAKREVLIREFPEHEGVIRRLSRI